MRILLLFKMLSLLGQSILKLTFYCHNLFKELEYIFSSIFHACKMPIASMMWLNQEVNFKVRDCILE